MNKAKRWAAVLGIFAGGMVLGQTVFTPAWLVTLQDSKTDTFDKQLFDLVADYTTARTTITTSAGLTAYSQEVDTRLQIMQVKQNQEIIKLLREIKAKK